MRQRRIQTKKEIIEANVNGIPCYAKIRYSPYHKGMREKGSNIQLEPDEEECYFIEEILDRKFYRAPWLERKVTSSGDIQEALELNLSEALSDQHDRLIPVVTEL